MDAAGAPYGKSGGALELFTTSGSMSAVVDKGDGTYTGTIVSTVAGTAVVNARLAGASLADTAGLQFLPGPVSAATVGNPSSNNQTAAVGAPVPNPPSVKVADAFGNGVPNITVTFAVTSGGGSVTGSTQITNAAGVATVGGWTLGNIAGANTLTATIPGPAAVRASIVGASTADLTVTFTATAVAGAPGSISLAGGEGQTAVAGTSVTTAPSVKVVDANNNPVSGASVSFFVAAGGGSITGASTTTNASGIAAVGSWTLGNVAGSNTLTAAAAGISGTVTISAVGVPGPAAAIAIANAGANNQSAAAGTALPIPPSVKVSDSRGNGVAGVAVNFAVASGGGSVTAANVTTNSAGIATVGSWTLGTTAGPNSLVATSGSLSGSPVTFNATGTAGAPGLITIVAGDAQTAIAGTAAPIAPSVKVTDQNGNAVAGATVTFTVVVGNGSIAGATATSNASGIATAGAWTLGVVAGENRLAATSGALTATTFTATGIAGGAAKIAAEAGNNQSAPIGTAVTVRPSVKVTDANGNAVSGAAVTFAVATGGGSITGAAASTDASGIAAVGSWALGPSTGSNTLTASSGSLTGSPVTFTATATAGVPGSITKHAGDAQNAVAGSNVAVRPTVKVTTSGGIAIAGVSVTFAVATGGGSVTDASATTDNAGIATVGSWKLGNTAGANTLNASVAGLSPVTFTATGTAGAAALIAINGGNGQSATVGTNVAIAPSVKVTDALGNAVSGAGVTFAVTAGGGSITGSNATSNASGIASVGSWTLGATAGANTLSASLNGVAGATVSFTATGAAIPPLVVSVSGRLERSQTVSVTVTQNGSTLAPSAYTLTVVPADGGQVNGDGTVKLLKAGSLTLNATAGSATGNTSVTVLQPPLFVFDLVRAGFRHIWQVALDGGDLVQLTTNGSDNQHGTRVGDKLVFASARNGQNFDIFAMTVSTQAETNLTSTTGFPERDPTLSPNGQRVTFVSGASGLDRARYMNADGSGAAHVADNSANVGAVEMTPAWSPASDKVIFSSTGEGGTPDIWIAHTLGAVATKLSSPANGPFADLGAEWSGTNSVVFHTNRSGSDEIWITNTTGSTATKLTDGASPAWTPDGRVVFVRYTAGSGALFWIDPANPSVVHPIDVGGGNAQRPSAVLP